MTATTTTGVPEKEGILRIRFENQKPISAADVGRMFQALSKDYSRVTGGTLVIARIETGSLEIDLAELMALAMSTLDAATTVTKGIKRMQEFVTLLKGLIDKPLASDLTASSPVTESVERVLTAAINSQSNIELSQKLSKDGSSDFKLKITSSKASERLRAVKIQRVRKPVYAGKPLAPPLKHEMLDSPDEPIDAQNFYKNIKELPLIASNLDSWARITANVLKGYGNQRIIGDLADAFEVEGRGDVAAALRKHIGPDEQHLQITRD